MGSLHSPKPSTPVTKNGKTLSSSWNNKNGIVAVALLRGPAPLTKTRCISPFQVSPFLLILSITPRPLSLIQNQKMGIGGFSRSRGRSFTASPLLSSPLEKKGLKKSESTKEKRTEEVKSFVERYREKYPGLFPKITEVHKAVGGSYNILKGIFSKCQQTFLQHSAGPTSQGQEEEFAKPCPKEKLNIDGVMPDRRNIGSDVSTKERDFIQREDLSGSETRCTDNTGAKQSEKLGGNRSTNSLYNIVKGLQNGPKSSDTASLGSKESIVELGTGSSECLGSAKEELSEQRDLNGTKGSFILEKDNKMSILFDIFAKMKNNPENGVDSVVKTNDAIKQKNISREGHGARSKDGSEQIGNIFSQIITKAEKKTCINTGSWAHTRPNNKGSRSSFVKALNISSDKTKYVGGITDVLSKVINGKNIPENDDSDSDIVAYEYLGFQPAVASPAPVPRDRSKYGLFVSFLDKATSVSDVYHALDVCGPLQEVHFISSEKHDQYKCANVFFKGELGLKNALNNTDPVIRNNDVVVRPMASHLLKRLRIHADMVVQDHCFPTHLLKYPSQSISIKGWMDNLPFDHLRRDLGLFGPVSAVAIGQDNSIVYVEFESEESVERVLEAARITVLGKNLKVYRVYAPKTTVVRVSNVSSQTDNRKIEEISNKFSVSKVKRVVQRGSGIFDIHFKLSELPNMLKILNRLNGLVFDQSQWIAQPATFIPVEIIQSLCDDPQGCNQLQEIFQNICMKMEGNGI